MRLRQAGRWLEGELSTEVVNGARCLVLRDWALSQDAGPKLRLYRPRLVAVDRLALRVQGLEPMTTHNQRTAAVLQEWAVRLFGTVPEGTAFSADVLGEL